MYTICVIHVWVYVPLCHISVQCVRVIYVYNVYVCNVHGCTRYMVVLHVCMCAIDVASCMFYIGACVSLCIIIHASASCIYVFVHDACVTMCIMYGLFCCNQHHACIIYGMMVMLLACIMYVYVHHAYMCMCILLVTRY